MITKTGSLRKQHGNTGEEIAEEQDIHDMVLL
jgi:hypothetical protein